MHDILKTVLYTAGCLAIFAVTVPAVLRSFFSDGRWDPAKGRSAFRFFTIQSNVFCALSFLAAGIASLTGFVPDVLRLIQYTSTAAVTVTMVTVLVFLGPTMGYGPLLGGWDLFLHLLTPLAAIGVFCFLDGGALSFSQSLLGLIPVAAYGILYCLKVVFTPEGQGWEDFYGFNRGGRWQLSFAAMLIGTFLICMALWALHGI